MQETQFIWLNDKLVKWKDAKIHILTHALHYGSGCFEGIRCYKTANGTAIFRLPEHISRMLNSFKIFDIKCPYSKKEIENAIIETAQANKLEEGYIRPILYFGYGEMGLRNIEKCKIDFAVACWPWPAYLGGKLLDVKIVKIKRIDPSSHKTEAKITGHYVNSILATLEAKREGADEALLLDHNNNIAEGPGENIFIVKNKILFTPKLGSILHGITRDSIITIARDLGIAVEEKDINVEELLQAEEAFFTGTACEVAPIGKIDKKQISSEEGKITKILHENYFDVVHGKNKKYEDWLTYL